MSSLKDRTAHRVLILFAIAMSSTAVVTIAGCSGTNPAVAASLNENASLPNGLPANPLRWQVVTSEIDKSAVTISTLFGDDQAIAYARGNPHHGYPVGATLAMVTWTEREDPRWYGALIPDQVQSVEFVFVESAPDGTPLYDYQKFSGSPLKQSAAGQNSATKDRTTYLLSQRAAVMP